MLTSHEEASCKIIIAACSIDHMLGKDKSHLIMFNMKKWLETFTVGDKYPLETQLL